MWTRDQWREFEGRPVVQTVLFVLGILLMLASIPVGALPGPGGIFVFAGGLALTLRTSMWAKRNYVRFKRWQPKAGRWADWGLRRRSARRREAIRKERKEIGCPLPPDELEQGPIAALVPDPPAKPPATEGEPAAEPVQR